MPSLFSELYKLLIMFVDDLRCPAEPSDIVKEANEELLRRLDHDLCRISRQELTALDAYRLYLPVADASSSWGYALEAARIATTNDVWVLFRNDEEEGVLGSLRWLPLSTLCTIEQAELAYRVTYRGPPEDVVRAILTLFRDAFVFAADTDWSYVKRLEFYYSFPFERLSTVGAVHRFRPVLFGRPAFTDSIDVDMTPPKSE